MTTVTMTIPQLQAAMGRVGGQQLNIAMTRAARKLAWNAQSFLQRYPRNSTHVVWRSRKQQRWYHAMRRAAGLPAKYTRGSDPMSQSLKHSWVVRTDPPGTGPNEFGAMLGTKVTYAHLVQGEATQEPMHKANNWPTDYDAIQEIERKRLVEKYVNAEMKSLIDKAFRG